MNTAIKIHFFFFIINPYQDLDDKQGYIFFNNLLNRRISSNNLIPLASISIYSKKQYVLSIEILSTYLLIDFYFLFQHVYCVTRFIKDEHYYSRVRKIYIVRMQNINSESFQIVFQVLSNIILLKDCLLCRKRQIPRKSM